MERLGDRGFVLSVEEVVRLIQQLPEDFDIALSQAIADEGDGETGKRKLIFSSAKDTGEFEAMASRANPPITVTG